MDTQIELTDELVNKLKMLQLVTMGKMFQIKDETGGFQEFMHELQKIANEIGMYLIFGKDDNQRNSNYAHQIIELEKQAKEFGITLPSAIWTFVNAPQEAVNILLLFQNVTK